MREIARGAWVIARRDYVATVRSKAFLLFLAGPLLPFLFGGLFDDRSLLDAMGAGPAVVHLSGSSDATHAWTRARDRLASRLGPDAMPAVSVSPPTEASDAVLSGDIDHPRLVAPSEDIAGLRDKIGLIAYDAFIERERRRGTAPAPVLSVTESAGSAGTAGRIVTARGSQLVLFLLTMLLSGILLSGLVEEKSTKTMEVLAAALPLDAIFFGKLGGMLAIALTGIAFWGVVLVANASFLLALLDVTAPAVGWPLFAGLAFIYTATAILLVGAIYLAIGAQAETTREVQSVAMPLTILQVLIFALASAAIPGIDTPLGLTGAILPWSSPFVMLGRAALVPALLPHVLAIGWQLVMVVCTVRLGALAFRMNVSGTNPLSRLVKVRSGRPRP